MALQIDQFTCRSDNYCVLVHDPESGETAIIDAPDEGPIIAAIERTGWTPTHILTTHHHGDHVAANEALKARFGLKIIGPKAEAAKIPGIDETVAGGDVIHVCGEDVRVIDTPGHTAGHIVYFFTGSKVLFAGDTLFSLGCGRLFEGSAGDMYGALTRLRALPGETSVYCGHEYTKANADFALSVDPQNEALKARAAEIAELRAADRPTLPTTIAREIDTNPFLRWDDAAIRAHLGMESADDVAVFAEIRKRKDRF